MADGSSLFVRRIVLLVAVMLLVFGGLTAQLVRWSVVEGGELRDKAEGRLDRTSYLPTYRGDILDRKGRPLATDIASYDIAVAYSLITGGWVDERALRAARRRFGKDAWDALSPARREEAMLAEAGPFQAEADEIWDAVMRHGHLTSEELWRFREEIMQEVQLLRGSVWDSQRRQWEDDREEQDKPRFANLGGEPPKFRPQAIREEVQPHVVLPSVDNETAFLFRQLGLRRDDDDDGEGDLVRVLDSTRRVYPKLDRDVVLDRSSLPRPLRSNEPAVIYVEGVADHVVGTVREGTLKEDIERRPFVNAKGSIDLGGYRIAGDRVGISGIERVFEDRLRGERGELRHHLDTDETVRADPRPGAPVRLTIDIELQAEIQAILSHRFGLTVVQPWHEHPVLPLGWPLNSAAVVIDVASGDVLAAVSMPTLAMARHMDSYRRQLDTPEYFRPTERMYPPGSIIKPLLLCAAVSEGVHDLHGTIECEGLYDPRITGRLRCWIYRDRYRFGMHGPLAADEALARSCNIFFYTLADRLGLPRLVDWLHRFGLDEPLDVGLSYDVVVQSDEPDDERVDGGQEQEDGQELAEDEKTVRRGEVGGWLVDPGYRGEAMPLGIGQQLVTWTPMQAANAYATMARRGVVRDASIVADPPPGAWRQREPRPDFPLDEALVRLAEEGLRRSVEELIGTGHHIRHAGDPDPEPIFDAPGVTVWGKTGTAQAPNFVVDLDGDRRIGQEEDDDGDDVSASDDEIEGLDHSWFVGLVGPRGGEPQVAVAVIVEYGGSGGRISGPIANQIIRALQRTGYVTRGEETEGP